MSKASPLALQMQILLLRQNMELQRQLICDRTYFQQNADQFPRSLTMRMFQQQLSNTSPRLIALKNKFSNKESALLWSVAFTLGQHWLQKKTGPER